MCGITTTPEHPRLTRSALGAEHTVAWSNHPNAVDLAAKLRCEGYRLWALESTAEAVSPAISPGPTVETGPIVLVVGNERAGVDPDLLSHCERVIELPMLGSKGSLNAAVAFGIAVYVLRFGNMIGS